MKEYIKSMLHEKGDRFMSFILYIVIFGFIAVVSGCTEESQPSENRLPESAYQFVGEWFSDENIEEVSTSGTGFEATMSGGTRIAFDIYGMWFRIENRIKPLPTGVLPMVVKDYLVDNRPNAGILLIERYSADYRVGLDTHELLTFDAQHNVAVLPWNVVDNNVEL